MHYTKSIKKVLIAVLGLSLVACAASPYESIVSGDSRAKVVTLLGEPSKPDSEVPLDVKNTISSTLQKLDNKDSEYFSIWWSDSAPVYVVGFNQDDKVAVKHRFFMLNQ
jgi:hypothetical protein